MNNTNL